MQGKMVIAESRLPAQKGTRVINDTGLLFDVEDEVLAGPARSVPAPVVSGSQEDF